VATKNPQRIELGQTLEGLRRRAGASASEVEERLGWHVGKCRKVETGDRTVSKAEVDVLADRFGVTPDERAALHLMADAARRRESATHVADFAQSYVALERQAAEIDFYDAELITALAMTEGYARAQLTTGTDRVEELVTERLVRGRILTRKTNAPITRILLGEAALYRQVGGQAVMREQIAHLLDLMRLPNVSIRILPFAVGAHLALGVGFTTLRLASPKITRVYTEGLTDATYIHEPGETAVYERGFDQLWEEVAADDDKSATILRRHITTEEHDGGETLEEID
jgi:hypothetical protein